MSQLDYFTTRFSLFFISFVGLSTLAFNLLDTLNIYSDIIVLATPISLTIAGLIAGQFGKGRLALLCILFGLTSLNASWFAFAQVTSVANLTCLSLLIAWLCWRADTELFSRAFLIRLLEMLVIASLYLASFDLLQLKTESISAQFHSYFYNLAPSIFSRFTAFEWLFYVSVLLPALIKLIWQPSHSHTLLLLAWITTTSAALEPNAVWIMTLSCILAAYIVVAIITYSFTMAYRDELTAIPSRRALMQHINSLGRSYVVVMADIDHFKKFNDTHGHDVGDQVLKLVAQKLDKVTGGGRAFRYGGEEFTLIFSGKSAEQVKPFVELVRVTIESYRIALRAKDRPKAAPKKPQKSKAKPKTVQVTCSFGIAERDPEHTEFESIMKLADNALYAAKKAGRNCVMLAKQ